MVLEEISHDGSVREFVNSLRAKACMTIMNDSIGIHMLRSYFVHATAGWIIL